MIKDYSDELLQHYRQPIGVGYFDENDANVGTGWAGTAENGDVIRIQIKVNDGVISQVCFKAQGSCATIAAGSWLVDWLSQRSVVVAREFDCQELIDALALPRTSRHSALLAHDALNAAIADCLS